MKILCLLGSPRSSGNSATIAGHLLESATGFGAVTRTIELNKLTYRGCQGCYACKKGLEHCVVQDDLTEVLEAVHAADVVVMASPVYYGDVTGQLKCFIDRMYSFLKPDYMTNPEPSRLDPKKLVMILTQGHPDESLFADIFPKYNHFLGWMGLGNGILLRSCGIGPATVDAPPEEILLQAEKTASELMS